MKTTQELIQQSDAVNRRSVSRQAAKYKKKGLDCSAFQHFWAVAISENFGGLAVPTAFSKKMAGVFKANTKEIDFPAGFDMEAFTFDVVTYWSYYMTRLKWAKIPRVPDINSVVYLVKHFVLAYSSSDRADYNDLLATDKKMNTSLRKELILLHEQLDSQTPRLELLERERRVAAKQLKAGRDVKAELAEKDRQIAKQREEMTNLRVRMASIVEGKTNDK